MKTKTGEVTIKCFEYTHLVKALRPLPEKFHGLTDIEERYRRRYVDLIMNEDSRKVAMLRPRIIRCIQNYMDGLGFTEVVDGIKLSLELKLFFLSLFLFKNSGEIFSFVLSITL